MDINKFMTRLDRLLGLSFLRLQKYFPTIQETLVDTTLPVLSQFIPYTYDFTLHLSKQTPETLFGMEQVYYLADPYLMKHNVEVISVETVEGTNTFTDLNQMPASFNVHDMIVFGEMSSIRSQLGMSYKAFDYLGGNRIRLKGFNGYESVQVTVKIPYPTIGAIPQSVSIEFEKLALLDIKMVLYPELKHYDKLETADGVIDLKIDDWANAEETRNQLLADWRNKAIVNQALGSRRIQTHE